MWSLIPQPTPQYGQVVSTCLTASGRTFFEKIAAVGHAAKHEPHDVQTDSRSGWSSNVPIFMVLPRPSSEMAPMCCTSSQAVTQRAQRMQRSISSVKNGLLVSTEGAGRISLVNARTPLRMRLTSGDATLTCMPSTHGVVH